LTLAPGGKGPIAHIHTRQTEGFETIEGSLVILINGKNQVLNKGEKIIVKAGEAHSFKNMNRNKKVVARFWYEPALQIEWMMQTIGEDAMANGGDWKNAPLLPVIYVMYKMRGEYRFAGIPFWLQDLIFGFLATIAKITGIYKKYDLPIGNHL